ncbi:hypothetical protein LEP1GSC026_2721 [Leptospira interrogans str. 2002000623]|uniref:Uncharacterized protein n=2 Tax=Leptospira interrogans TaxID=173 RepID=M6ZFV2_LEPIR|nr:hypothetical protein LEP1GSC025_0162 [Leptospira interrogans str. 2002000621]EKQ48643.1 hypothetical protein LEP1GSC026_2721 [Leptospira interrogans str. 2002000623]EKR84866.1 hypothetical protein LEP1GSC099_1237 [Leptospira interrogans str. UI 08452]EMF71637.1 hypothetical protein LEP1GSC148_3689 [Leptospira interrogans serovar Canicola str. LT1962]EMN08406.1 hypothetical protein LEP1GSC053_2746 [Leptospira interrogans serovar Muenchen str. Brem 129]EMN36844.1 hypothetical protein LEP1GSC0
MMSLFQKLECGIFFKKAKNFRLGVICKNFYVFTKWAVDF